MMITKNANVNVQSENCEAALISALKNGNFKAAELLIENGAKLKSVESLTTAIKHCPKLELVQLILAKSSNVDLRNKHGEKALMTALQSGISWSFSRCDIYFNSICRDASKTFPSAKEK